jgi:hypothetical protein
MAIPSRQTGWNTEETLLWYISKYFEKVIQKIGTVTGTIPVNTSQLNNDSGFITIGDIPAETDPITGAINGIVKANGAGVISAAVAGDMPESSNYRTVTDAEKITWNAKQSPDIVTAFQITPDDTHYPSEKLTKDSLDDKQDVLVSNVNIKTINSNSLVGAGNVVASVVNWRGVYSLITDDYIPNDAVSYLGSSYICILAPIAAGILPTDTDYWNIMAQMGNPGVSGVSGSFVQPFSGVSSVTVTHNFNTFPVVQVIDGSDVVITPSSITHSSTMELVVAFGGNTTGNVICTIGGVSTAVITKGANYTLLPDDNLILVNAACTITLPATTGLQGKIYYIKHITNNGVEVIVNTTGGKTIDGESSKIIIAQWTTMTLFTDGTNWFIL